MSKQDDIAFPIIFFFFAALWVVLKLAGA